MHHGNYGVYFIAETTLWRTAGSGSGISRQLGAFVRTGFSPNDRNAFSQTADAGLGVTGLLPGRAADILSVGVAWVKIGQGARRCQLDAGSSSIPDYEVTFETNYIIELGKHWHVIPDLQWVCHPGGSRALPDALATGLRTRVEF